MGNEASPVGSIVSGFMGQNQYDWYKNALVNILNNLNTANSTGLNYAFQNLNPTSDAAKQLLSLAPQYLFGNGDTNGDMNSLRDQFQKQLSGISPDAFKQSGLTPELQALLGGTSGTSDLLKNVVANGGGSEASNSVWQALQGILGNQGNNAQGAAALRLLNNPQTPFTQTAQQVGQNALSTGGMTPDLTKALSSLQYIIDKGGSNSNMDAGVNRSLDLLSGNSPIVSQLLGAAGGGLGANLGVTGLTPTGAQGETTALQGLQNQGANATTNFFTNRGAQLAGTDAILPTLLATSLARDEASRNIKNAATDARAQALAHGGGPGAVVANGTTNDALADFSGRAGDSVSAAVEQALKEQQGLLLQQQGQGAQMGLAGGQLQNSNFRNSGDLLTSLEGVATNRYGVGGGLLGNAGSLSNSQMGLGLNGLSSLAGLQSQNMLSALGMIPQTTNAGTNRANVLGNMGLGAGQLDLSGLEGGGQLNNGLNSNLLNALSGMQGNVNQANNYTLGASGALNSLFGNSGNTLLGAGQLGNNQTANFYSALSNLLTGQGSLVNQEQNMYNMGMNPLLDIGKMGFGYSGTALSGMPSIFHGFNAQNPLGQGIADASGSIQKMAFPTG